MVTVPAEVRKYWDTVDVPPVARGFAAFPTAPHAGERGAIGEPDLTPRTARMLALAGRRLAREVRSAASTTRLPVSMYYLARALDSLTTSLEEGRRPQPRTLASQLCLHVMIACANDMAYEVGDALAGGLPYSEYDYDFESLYYTLLPDDAHEAVIWEVQQSSRGNGAFDFGALCDVLPDRTVNELFQRRAESTAPAP